MAVKNLYNQNECIEKTNFLFQLLYVHREEKNIDRVTRVIQLPVFGMARNQESDLKYYKIRKRGEGSQFQI